MRRRARSCLSPGRHRGGNGLHGGHGRGEVFRRPGRVRSVGGITTRLSRGVTGFATAPVGSSPWLAWSRVPSAVISKLEASTSLPIQNLKRRLRAKAGKLGLMNMTRMRSDESISYRWHDSELTGEFKL